VSGAEQTMRMVADFRERHEATRRPAAAP
jgi:hypothetical protein